MKHLDDEQLGAHLDGALPAAAAADAERHLAQCESCRGRLASLTSLDASLSRALDHDPGEAYFASFADRVATRIAAQAAPAAASPAHVTRAGWLAWLTPRRMAWAGGAMALAVVAAIALVLSREQGPESLATRVAPRSEVGEGAPAMEKQAPGTRAREAAPQADESTPQAASPEPARTLETPAPARRIESPAPARTIESPAPAQGGATLKERAAAGKRTDALQAAPPASRRELAPPFARAPASTSPPASTSAPVFAPAPVPVSASPPAATRTKALARSEADARGNLAGGAAPQAAAPAPQNVVEMKTLPNGEQVAVPSSKDRPAWPGLAQQRKTGGFLKPPVEPVRQGLGSPPNDSPRGAATPLTGALDKAATVAPRTTQEEAKPGEARALARDDAAAGAAGAFRICGTVRGPSGVPLAGATVSVSETGTSARSAADGSFCLDAPGARATLSAYAVGYQVYRAGVTSAEAANAWTVTLLPVETLSPGGGWGAGASAFLGRGTVRPSGALETAQRRAREATGEATRVRTAGAWERAANAWREVDRATTTEAGRLDARFRVAEACVQAWRLDPTPGRVAAGSSAVDAYLTGAPQGPMRDLVEGWKRELNQ